ncbi:hypothetical protein [Streptomyces sp. NPDC001970]
MRTDRSTPWNNAAVRAGPGLAGAMLSVVGSRWLSSPLRRVVR